VEGTFEMVWKGIVSNRITIQALFRICKYKKYTGTITITSSITKQTVFNSAAVSEQLCIFKERGYLAE
jgi:hypothetical protein